MTREELDAALRSAATAGGYVCVYYYDDEFVGLDQARQVESSPQMTNATENYRRSNLSLSARVKPSACPGPDACQGTLIVFQSAHSIDWRFVPDRELNGSTAGCFQASELHIDEHGVLESTK